MRILPIWRILFLFLFVSLEFTNYSYSYLYKIWLRVSIPLPIRGKNNYSLITGLVQNRTFKQSQRAIQRLNIGSSVFILSLQANIGNTLFDPRFPQHLEVCVSRRHKHNNTYRESQRDMATLFWQPLTKGSWAGMVSLTVYMAAIIRIEEYLMEKFLKIPTNLNTKF